MTSVLPEATRAPHTTRTAAVTAGLRELADFLDRHPELPAPDYLARINTWFATGAAQDHAIWDAAEADGYGVTVDAGDGLDVIEVRFGAVTAKALVDAPRRAGCDHEAAA